MVVVWSRHSIKSEWVKNEATVANKRNVLVPVVIDPIELPHDLPLESQRKQFANLDDWDGDSTHEPFNALCVGIKASIERAMQSEWANSARLSDSSISTGASAGECSVG